MNKVSMRFPNGLSKCLTLSYDDGVVQDMRLAQIMKRYGIAGTFNLNSGLFSRGRHLTPEQAKETFSDSSLFEVATHSLEHPFLNRIAAPAVLHQIMADRVNLEALFGGICRGHAYAYGAYNSEVIRLLSDCGIAYARTVKSTECFTLPENWLALHPTCHHKNPRLMELADSFIYDETVGDPWMFYLWGHSYEFDDNDNWNVIEEFCDHISGHSNIWYATNIEIYDYVRDWNRLIWSADGKTVHNPTARPLWLQYYRIRTSSTVCQICAGETVTLE